MLGGGQEKGIRSGTENIPGIVGMGKAAEITESEMATDSERLTGLRDKLIDGVLKRIDHSFITGHRTKRLPDHASIRFSFIEGESLLLNLDMEEISVSTGSACTSKTLEPSHVLRSMGVPFTSVHGSIRFSLSIYNTEEEVDFIIDRLPQIITRLREMSPFWQEYMKTRSASA